MNYFNQTSPRLRFRKLRLEDIPTWTTFFVDNDRLRFLGIDLSHTPERHARGWIEKQLERYETQGLGHLAIELKESNAFIGVGGILPRTVDGKDELEIAYSLLPSYWGKGYATELAVQLKDFGFANLDAERLISIIHQENLPSIRVAEKNAMQVILETTYLDMPVQVYGIQRALTKDTLLDQEK